MRTTVVVAAVMAVAWMAFSSMLLPDGAALAQTPGGQTAKRGGVGDLVTQAGVAGDMIALVTPAGEGRQLLTIVDSKQQTVAVYHVDVATGKIALGSVRQIEWDLKLSEFNSDHPLPGEIRGLLKQR